MNSHNTKHNHSIAYANICTSFMNSVLHAHHGRQSMYRFRISVKKQAISFVLARSQRRAHVIDFYCSQVSRREFWLLELLSMASTNSSNFNNMIGIKLSGIKLIRKCTLLLNINMKSNGSFVASGCLGKILNLLLELALQFVK